jgi:hypothetical protein
VEGVHQPKNEMEKYETIRKIGRGTYGDVVLVESLETKQVRGNVQIDTEIGNEESGA